jgi:hypothetical protein
MVVMTDSTSPTDKRIDDLRSETRHGFHDTGTRVDDLRSEMRQGFQQVDGRFERVETDVREIRSDIGSLKRMMIGFFATTLGSIVAGVIVIVASHS